MTRVLVTGFAPWAEHVENPSTALAFAMDGLVIEHVTFIARAPIPVEFGRGEAVAHAHAVELGADVHLALGLAAVTPYLRVERLGRNRSTTPSPDNAGLVAHDVEIIEGAAPTLASPIDVLAVVDALVRDGYDARESDDAGGYVCNDVYFRALHRGARPTLFVHVPTDVMQLPNIAASLARAVARALGAS